MGGIPYASLITAELRNAFLQTSEITFNDTLEMGKPSLDD